MKFSISHADSWNEFKETWLECMRPQEWYYDPTPVDYNGISEEEELRNDFENEDHVYLIAKDESGNGVGVLEFMCYPNFARNGIMMPGVQDQFKALNIGDSLLRFQEFYLQNRGINIVVSSVKYKSREDVNWYFDTLSRTGFKMSEPEGFQMYTNLNSIDITPEKSDYVIKTREEYSDADFVDFAMRAYASTPEDLEVHGWDLSVTDSVHILAIHNRTRGGGFGRSPPHWWRVISKNKNPMGYILAFEINPTDSPRVGTIGNLGVFPEYRREGLAITLIHSLFLEFIKEGIEIARVGTPTINTRAISAYRKAGFIEGNRIQFFRKEI
jgi:ribosomal protein S18 acetylase RimI-like enzyme